MKSPQRELVMLVGDSPPVSRYISETV